MRVRFLTMRLHWLVISFIIILTPLGIVMAADTELWPNAELTPDQVVRIQVEALGANDVPEQNAGIAVTFRFASPSNRRVTGPLNRFILMVSNPMYKPMLNHRRAEYEPIKIEGDNASQIVVLTAEDGSRAGYLFVLSKQQGSGCDACWMTDSVMRLQVPEQQEV